VFQRIEAFKRFNDRGDGARPEPAGACGSVAHGDAAMELIVERRSRACVVSGLRFMALASAPASNGIAANHSPNSVALQFALSGLEDLAGLSQLLT
jgi:hypothetical protein